MTIKIGANIRIHKVGLSLIIILLILLYFYAIRESSYLNSKLISKDFVSLKSLLASSIIASEIGGVEVFKVHNDKDLRKSSKGKTKEGIDDPVTEADYRSHCAMFNYLSNNFPSVKIISEEHTKSCDAPSSILNHQNVPSLLKSLDIGHDLAVDAEDITVWIDPLDATKEFTEDLLEYVTTMVCIAVKGIPLIGVIHRPFNPQQTFWAWVYHGFSENLQISVSNVKGPPVLIVSRSHAGKVHNASKNALGDDVKIISAAGAGYKALEVATKNATAYVHMTAIKKWDICAGTAIITALGGMVTTLNGKLINDFESTDSVVLDDGILATMNDHKWYLDKFKMN